MELLTIGAFAHATRLSPKALRLYDELGLLPPAAVDGVSGYRFYAPAQLEPARLIAWLRRLGMPLARIRTVLAADPAGAAAEISAYRAELVAEAAGRERLATFLVDYLNGRGSAMGTVGIRYAAKTDIGRVRGSNQDVAYAGSRLLAVADGAGEHGAGASAAAVEALLPLQEGEVPAADLLNALAEATSAAGRAMDSDAATTLTAMLWSGSRLGLVHIGDSRAYRLRDRELYQITHDHTLVQSLVDEGKLSREEAASHPQAMMLARALTGSGTYSPDLSAHEAVPGDRYLLCSDGLSRVVSTEDILAVLLRTPDPDAAVERLIGLAYAAGAPDNIACVVADVIDL